MVLHGLTVLVQHRLAADVARYETVVDLRVVPPLCPITVSPADFGQTGELIDRARAATEAWLAAPGPTRIHQASLLEPHAHGPSDNRGERSAHVKVARPSRGARGDCSPVPPASSARAPAPRPPSRRVLA
jgi:hypothetical protein